jgi:hypothetical protein
MFDIDMTVNQPFGIAMDNNLIPGKVVLRDVGFVTFNFNFKIFGPKT